MCLQILYVQLCTVTALRLFLKSLFVCRSSNAEAWCEPARVRVRDGLRELTSSCVCDRAGRARCPLGAHAFVCVREKAKPRARVRACTLLGAHACVRVRAGRLAFGSSHLRVCEKGEGMRDGLRELPPSWVSVSMPETPRARVRAWQRLLLR